MHNIEEARNKIIVALDVSSLDDAKILVKDLAPHVGYFKIGLELSTAVGAPKVVSELRKAGARIFYDGKFKDIPNTLSGASRAVTKLGVDMFNVHCFGGSAMMREAREMTEKISRDQKIKRPLILGVTLLTSLDYDDLVELRICDSLNIADPEELARLKRESIERFVAGLALLAQESGLDGVIASPQEINVIRRYCQPEFLIVTPGVRPKWASTDDQKRVMTPDEAIVAGADFVVIGRPITKPPAEIGSPVDAVKKITEEIALVL